MNDLPDGARQALDRARASRGNYAVRVLRATDGRLVAVLGEMHLKLAKAAQVGKDVVGNFELRGVVTFQREQVAGGLALGLVIQAPRTLLRIASLGAIKGSTITDAKQLPFGHTVEIERAQRVPLGLHVASLYMTAFFIVSFLAPLEPRLVAIAPFIAGQIGQLAALFRLHLIVALPPAIALRRYSWSWLVHPFLGILTLRDELMAAGTVQMLADHPGAGAAVIVLGRAHVQGISRLLVERYGFTVEAP